MKILLFISLLFSLGISAENKNDFNFWLGFSRSYKNDFH